MARAALDHASVEHVTMVEIDAGVVEFSKEYLPMLSRGAFDDPRLELVIADGGAEFMKTTKGGYDVIIIDSTDPIGPGEVLFTDHFYGHAKRALAPNGILVTQNGVPFMQGDELTGTMRAFKTLFADATCYLATVPTYAGGPMAFGWGGTDGGDAREVPLDVLRGRFDAAELDTGGYYTPPEVHKVPLPCRLTYPNSFRKTPSSAASLGGAADLPPRAIASAVRATSMATTPPTSRINRTRPMV